MCEYLFSVVVLHPSSKKTSQMKKATFPFSSESLEKGNSILFIAFFVKWYDQHQNQIKKKRVRFEKKAFHIGSIKINAERNYRYKGTVRVLLLDSLLLISGSSLLYMARRNFKKA